MSATMRITDHQQIRRWVEDHDGRPACVQGAADCCEPSMLRLDFDDPGEPLEPISWDQWFDCFDHGDLALVCGESSRFNKLAPRH
jgi:hypothetical protein